MAMLGVGQLAVAPAPILDKGKFMGEKGFIRLGRFPDRICTLLGLILLLTWVQLGNGIILILGLLVFAAGCALRSKWEVDSRQG
jgi:hypothetical protein